MKFGSGSVAPKSVGATPVVARKQGRHGGPIHVVEIKLNDY